MLYHIQHQSKCELHNLKTEVFINILFLMLFKLWANRESLTNQTSLPLSTWTHLRWRPKNRTGEEERKKERKKEKCEMAREQHHGGEKRDRLRWSKTWNVKKRSMNCRKKIKWWKNVEAVPLWAWERKIK